MRNDDTPLVEAANHGGGAMGDGDQRRYLGNFCSMLTTTNDLTYLCLRVLRTST